MANRGEQTSGLPATLPRPGALLALALAGAVLAAIIVAWQEAGTATVLQALQGIALTCF